jgi:hypothetical protein
MSIEASIGETAGSPIGVDEAGLREMKRFLQKAIFQMYEIFR